MLSPNPGEGRDETHNKVGVIENRTNIGSDNSGVNGLSPRIAVHLAFREIAELTRDIDSLAPDDWNGLLGIHEAYVRASDEIRPILAGHFHQESD